MAFMKSYPNTILELVLLARFHVYTKGGNVMVTIVPKLKEIV